MRQRCAAGGSGIGFGAPLRLNDEFHDRGTLLIAGPFADPAEGAMGLFTSQEAAEEFGYRDWRLMSVAHEQGNLKSGYPHFVVDEELKILTFLSE